MQCEEWLSKQERHHSTNSSADSGCGTPGVYNLRCKGSRNQVSAHQRLRPPEGAPNVLIVLIDDAGFGSSSAFGGPCQTPNAEKLAAGGLMFNRFHTTALCSPTRQALLTGRNHHSAHMGGITEIATSAPGYDSILPNTMSPLARTLKLNGYSTAQFGKCHEVPVWQTSPVGPFNAWPHGRRRLRIFLWLHRGRGESVVSVVVRRHDSCGAKENAGRTV